jgi:hypothetical protein
MFPDCQLSTYRVRLEGPLSLLCMCIRIILLCSEGDLKAFSSAMARRDSSVALVIPPHGLHVRKLRAFDLGYLAFPHPFSRTEGQFVPMHQQATRAESDLADFAASYVEIANG